MSDARAAASARLEALAQASAVLVRCAPEDRARKLGGPEASARRALARLESAAADDAQASTALEDALAAFAGAIRDCANVFPVRALYASLPACLPDARAGMLALLDLLAIDAYESEVGVELKLGVVDAVLTVLCTEGAAKCRVSPIDPVTVTPTVGALCARADAEWGAEYAELEAAFFSGANFAADLSRRAELRELAARKAKLGRSYFTPGLLRAIVTFNLTLLQSMGREGWGEVWDASAPRAREAQAGPSLFELPALQELAGALARRLAGETAQAGPVDRIAWSLAIDGLAESELEPLRSGDWSSERLEAAIECVGLLLRAREVIALDLQELGIDPDADVARWIDELDALVKGAVNESIAGGELETSAYERACGLSTLRNRFLVPGGRRPSREGVSAQRALREAREEREHAHEARALAEAAVAQREQEQTRARHRFGPRGWPGVAIGLGACAAALALTGLIAIAGPALFSFELDRWSGGELDAVSPYLVRGHRNGGGEGAAFVGEIDESWLALPEDERESAAIDLVVGLRARGVTQVMLYDGERRLRIQALGDTLRLE